MTTVGTSKKQNDFDDLWIKEEVIKLKEACFMNSNSGSIIFYHSIRINDGN